MKAYQTYDYYYVTFVKLVLCRLYIGTKGYRKYNLAFGAAQWENFLPVQHSTDHMHTCAYILLHSLWAKIIFAILWVVGGLNHHFAAYIAHGLPKNNVSLLFLTHFFPNHVDTIKTFVY